VSDVGQIEGYAIVSADGMLANSDGVMPPGLIVPADQVFFERALDAVDVVVHGRFSQEQHLRSPSRRRIVVSRRVAGIMPHPDNSRAILWNPAGASLQNALAKLGLSSARIGVVGGTDVFGYFLPLFDLFYLSRVPDLTLPGGRPVFPDVPEQTPEHILAANGLKEERREMLDPDRRVDLLTWRRMEQGGERR
jgi:dihydrofolate reductase